MTNILSDTSVFIAAAVREHPNHEASFRLVRQIQQKKIKGAVCCHSIAECFAVLTGLPRVPEFSPLKVRELIQRTMFDLCELVDLSARDYRTAVNLVAERQLKSGAVFDALIAQAALKKKIPVLVTWNLKHFERFSSQDLKIRTPADF